MSMELFSHNRTAYESALAMMAETGKAAVIHPTGTGKSFIGFQLVLDHPGKRICWLSPSEYIFRTQLENLAKANGGGAKPGEAQREAETDERERFDREKGSEKRITERCKDVLQCERKKHI